MEVAGGPTREISGPALTVFPANIAIGFESSCYKGTLERKLTLPKTQQLLTSIRHAYLVVQDIFDFYHVPLFNSLSYTSQAPPKENVRPNNHIQHR